MAGGKAVSFKNKNQNNLETLKEGQDSAVSNKFSLRGILGLNQPAEISKQRETKPTNWGKEFFGNISHLEKEQKILFDQHQQSLEKAIKDLQHELKKLSSNRDKLSTEVKKVSITPTVEFNDYQVNFLIRIKNFIIGISESISEASIWLQSFSKRKNKKNFWNKARTKKNNTFDQELMFSGEHSASRSVN